MEGVIETMPGFGNPADFIPLLHPSGAYLGACFYWSANELKMERGPQGYASLSSVGKE